MSQTVQTGEKVGDYVVERLIGRGALGEVYLVRRDPDGERFAMKTLLPDVAEDNPEYIQRFVREGRLAMKMRHPNIVAVHDVGYSSERGVYYLVMDYVRGGDLRAAIAIGGAMEPGEAVRIVASVASALASGERFGLVHRDIKPENVMIEDDGSVKLVDLGVAKVDETDSLHTMSNAVFGTPNYISPEQASDSSKVDSRADVYSLGIVLFELLTGRRPYEGSNPADAAVFLFSSKAIPDVRTVNPSVPAPLAKILARMCEKRLDRRIASASALVEEFNAAGLLNDADPPSRSRVQRRAPEDDRPFDYAAYIDRPANNTLTFDTEDTEIAEFVARLKTRRRRHRIVVAAAVAAAVVAVLAALLL